MKKLIFLGLAVALLIGIFMLAPWGDPEKKISKKHRVNGVIVYTEMVTENGTDYFQKAVFAYTVADSIFVSEHLLNDDFKVQYPGNEVVVEFYESDTTLSKIVESKNNYPINAKQNFSWKHKGYVSTLTFINSIAFYATFINENEFSGGFYAVSEVVNDTILRLTPLKFEGLYQPTPVDFKIESENDMTKSLVDLETGQEFI